MKFNVNDKVKLKHDYNGYFKDFKGQILTISEILIDYEFRVGYSCKKFYMDKVKIKEFSEVEDYHLLNIDNFDHVNEIDVLKSMDKLIISVIK